MTTKTVEGKTKCISDIITPSYADVQTLCKMVDKRDEIIDIANAESLKRGCRISELQQKCEQFEYNYSLSRLDAINQTTAFEKVLECGRIEKRELQEMCDDYESRLNRSESSLANSKSQFSDVIKAKDCELVKLTEELKCLKSAKDKTDAENTRLWALDKNEMHRKYEELHKHHLYEVGSLNETIDNQCKRIAGLKETQSTYEIAYRAYASETYELRNEIKLLKQHVNISVSTST